MYKVFTTTAGIICAAGLYAQTLTPVFEGSAYPVQQNWQELRFDSSINNHAASARADALTAALAGSGLKIQAAAPNKYGQLGWIKSGLGLHADMGYTIEVRAKVTSNSGGAFNIQGADQTGKGFRIALTPTGVQDATNPFLPPADLNTAVQDNSGTFHTWRIAAAWGDTVLVYRDNVFVGKFVSTHYAGDNWVMDGGFEQGAGGSTPAGWTEGNNGTATKETGSHARSGTGGYYVNEGKDYKYEVPLKPQARYDFSFWAKSIVNDGDKYRDVEGWLDPISRRPINGYPSRGATGEWIKYGGGGSGQWDNIGGDNVMRNYQMSVAGGEAAQKFTISIMSNNDQNVTDFDEVALVERVGAEYSRIPHNAENLFPNGDFEDETQIREGGYTEGAGDDTTYVANCTAKDCPDWHRLWKCRVRLESNTGADDEAGAYWSHSGKYALRYFARERAAAYGTQDAGVWEGRGQNTDMDYEQDLEAGKTYTLSFWYKSFCFPDHIRFRVLNGSQVVWRNDNISHDKYPFWENVVVTFTADAQNHTLRLLTEQHNSDPGAIYLDDIFLFEGQPLPEYDGSHIFFGKSVAMGSCDVEIESITYAIGAFAPDGTEFEAQWRPKPAPLTSVWGEQVTQETIPFNNAYPRPQLVRDNWTNLNGIWRLAKKPSLTGFGIYSTFAPDDFRLKIMVPYPIESALSGIMDNDYSNPNKFYAYRRTFVVADADRAEDKRIILHFEAVDWEAQVFVNGQKAGVHQGGFDPFWFDITDYLAAGEQEQELVVHIWDPTSGGNPSGKQTSRPQGIWYTPSSGIWQTVWYESVPPVRIAGLNVTPDVDNNAVKIRVNTSGTAQGALTAQVQVLDAAGDVVSTDNISVNAEQSVSISAPQLWSPSSPYLYGLKVTLKEGGDAKDEAQSYFGMRKVSLGTLRGKPFTMLNGEPIFHFGTLDQGFWPDGLHTAPSYEALRFDIEKTKELGFNMIRKHIKTEPARWYYYCDSIGIMVWQDMPTSYDDQQYGGYNHGNLICNGSLADSAVCVSNGGNSDEAVRANFLRESQQIVQKFSHFPSIVVWVPYNEGWGQYGTGPVGLRHTRNGVNLVRSLDTTRLINPVSGWHQYENAGYDLAGGDIFDKHNYREPALWDNPSNKRANFCGETGGYSFGIAGHNWAGNMGNYDDGTLTTFDSACAACVKFADRFRKFGDIAFSRTLEGINGIVYTQITDVEEELNGLWTYDRKVCKLSDTARMVLMQVIDTMKNWVQNVEYILPTAIDGSESWKYVTGNASYAAPEGWNTQAFDDSGWQEGIGGFGNDNPPGSKIRTQWNNQNIYLRKTVNIPAMTDGEKAQMRLAIHHDEGFELYINGVPAASATGYLSAYKTFDISAEARAAIVYGGNNLIAIHCAQTAGGQYIDAGIIMSVEVIPFTQDIAATPPPAPEWIEVGAAAEFDAIRNNLNGYYKLTADIDLSAYPDWQPIGTLASPFRGRIDGNRKTISGLTITAPAVNSDANKRKGLFGYAVDASFADLELLQPAVSGHSDIGSLLGKGAMVLIERVAVIKPFVNGVDHVGGIAGGTDAGILSHIKDCYVAGGEIASVSQVGGILGVAKNTRIENTYFTGRIIAPNEGTHNNAGGIIGLTEADNNSLVGAASLASHIWGGTAGEFAARGQALVDISNTYARSDMFLSDYFASADVGLGRATDAQKKSIEDLKAEETYTGMGWSFGSDGVWKMSTATEFPIFVYKEDEPLPAKFRQGIVWQQTLTASVGAAIKLTATASSSLDITYTSSDHAIARTSSDTLYVLQAGEVTITASQAGNETYEAAANVTKSITIPKSAQTITWTQTLPAAPRVGDAAVTLTAEASSGLDIIYTSSAPSVAAVSGTTLTFVGAGPAVITASQAGNGSYEAAADVTKSVTVGNALAISADKVPALAVRPNPVRDGVFTIDGLQEGERVEVYGLNGVLLGVYHTAVISIANLPAGAYVVKAGGKSAKVVKK